MSKYKVLKVLVEQAKLVQDGSELSEGKLWHFRTAIKMQNYPEVVRWVKSYLEQDLFASLEEIRRMEHDYIIGVRSTLAVQCHMILELAIYCTYFISEQDMRYKQSFFFDHCQTFAAIARLRSRLNFLGPRSVFREKAECELVDAVYARLADSVPTWLDMLLVFKVADQDTLHRLLTAFAGFLRDESFHIPPLGATLLLSFVAEALRAKRCLVGQDVAMRLLMLGASPMVSFADHQSFFEMIYERQDRGGDRPWWLEAEEDDSGAAERGPTAFRRLLSCQKSNAFRLALEQTVCCYLDARRFCSRTFRSKFPSLKCLAARQIKASQLAALPPCLEFGASNHAVAASP